MYTKQLSLAFDHANTLHKDQRRKGQRKVPYITHLMAVANYVAEYGGSEDQVIAALLHDAVEDQGVRLQDLETLYGPKVAEYVEALSDYVGPKGQPKPEWKERKTAYLAHLCSAEPDLKLIACADKLHNALSTLRDLKAVGEPAWQDMRGREKCLWYYHGVIGALSQGWEHPLLQELTETVARMERF